MRNYIILNGKNSNEINGLLIQELPPISKPQIRTETEEIDGRDGDIVTKLGFAAYDKEISVGLYKDFDINEIIAYFNSEGTIVFSNEPDKYYNYQILDQIDYERLVRYRVATVTMHVQPFKYSATEGTITIDSSDTVSGEGSNIALDGTAEAPFNVLRHKGNATQQTYSGKNKMPMASAVMQDNTDRQRNFSITLPAGTYTISYNLDDFSLGTNTSIAVYMSIFGEGSTQLIDVNLGTINSSTALGRKSTTFTITDDGTTDRQDNIRISQTQWNNGARATLSDIQIEAGSTATAYEIFVGGIPSPSPDYPQDIQVVTGDSTVKIIGKNLLNLHDGYMNAQPSRMDAEIGTNSLTLTAISAVGAQYTTWQKNFDPTKTYILSGKGKKLVTGTDGRPFLQVRWRGSNDGGTTWSNYVNVYTNETPSINTEYAYNGILTGYALYQILFYNNSYTPVSIGEKTTYYDLQIEQGDQATDYEEFKSQSYVIPFGNTYLAKIGDYADEPVKVDGTWYIRRAIGKQVVSIAQKYDLSGGLKGGVCNVSPAKNQDVSASICDKATQWQSGQTMWAGCYYANPVNFMFVGTADDTLETLKTKYDGATLYYVLATPTDEAITNQDLIDALDDFYDQAHGYKGHTHITATAADGNAPAVLSVEVGEDNESTVTNSGNINSKPVIKIYGSGNIGAYLNDIQILQIALGDEGYITIDTNLMEAYKDTLDNLKNRLVTGDYSKFSLKPGANKIHFSGTVTKYEISKYSRWL